MSEIKFPGTATPAGEILDSIARMQKSDADWRNGRLFALIYHAESELEEVTKEAYLSCFSLNALSIGAFPSLAQMEADVVGMTGDLLGLAGAPGSLTSGGTESNLLAVKSARDRARRLHPELSSPEMVVPMSGHPTLTKAGEYLGVKVVRVAVEADQRASLDAVEDAITPNTILIVGSAPSWPHGVVDPIVQLGRLAVDRGLLLHVDACVGGFVLPFAKQLGRPVPDFDLSVDGVTSISADIHKFGYAPKGASVVLYKSSELYDYQPFAFDEWTGGAYAVPTALGSRAGGAVAAAWATLKYLGLPGYLQMTQRCLDATQAFIGAIEGIDGLHVVGDPQFNLFAFGSNDPALNIAAIHAGMRALGWMPLLQGNPPSTLHLTITPSHDRVAGEFKRDLFEVVERARRGEISAVGVTARYN